jgi:hypothetical protein
MEPLNTWDVSYPTILFLEKILTSHKIVESFEREQDILFRVRRKKLSPVNILLVGCYVIGVADVIRAKTEFPDLTCMVANGNWCGYTQEAKSHGLRHGVGVFIVSDVPGLLFKKEPNAFVSTKNGHAYRGS